RCGDVDIPYPFGAGPAGSCSISPELHLHCNDTGGNGVHKLFLPNRFWRYDNIEVVVVDVIHGQMRVVSPIFYSCFTNHNTTSEGRSLHYGGGVPEPYRFSSTSNKFTVFGCFTVTYIAGDAYEHDGDVDDARWYMAAGCVADCRGNRHPTNGSCTGMGCCQSIIQAGDEGLHSYSATLNNMSYGFNFSTSYLVPSNEFNKTQVPVVLDWVIRNKTCRATQTHPAGYACVSNHSECVDASECVHASGGRDYRCRCTEGFQGNPYVNDPEQGCREHFKTLDIDECKDSSTYPCYGNCYNRNGGYDCVCPEETQGNPIIGECIRDPFPFRVRLAIGISAGVLVVVISFLAIKVLLHKRQMKRQALFQHNGGQLLKHMLKVEGNDSFTIYSRGDIVIASRNFHKMRIIGEGANGTVYKVTIDIAGTATAVAEFVRELVILCHLIHPNIVKLVGCCLEFEAPMLVYEFVQNGNLNQLLHGRPRRRVSLPTWLRIAAESAEALAHLHTHPVHPVLHGDVKPENIVLADGWIAKVSDFGCSTIKDNVQVVPKGTLAYLDPEFLHSFQLTDKGDVYSFGVVLVELLTRKKPRSTSKEEKNMAWIFQESMRQGTLHELLDKDTVLEEESSMVVIQQVAELASRCLAVPSATRPSMSQVAQQLRQLKDQVVEVECPQEVEHDLGPTEMEMTTGYPTAQTLSTDY
ncbi:hypothetical protein BS78_05G257500, partial [Paspalum vaginatum]